MPGALRFRPSVALLFALAAGLLPSAGGLALPPAPAGLPWPAGDEWPEGLPPHPYRVDPPLHVAVRSFDGTTLDGWLVLPDGPGGGPVPTVLWSSPYFGNGIPAAYDPAAWDNSEPIEEVPVDLLVAHGYAVAMFNVRGTGNSGGCLEMWGPKEQRDQAVLVDWIDRQPWSNHRVGMMGGSYNSATALAAAVQKPAALRALIVTGVMADPYTFYHSPQGAAKPDDLVFPALFEALHSLPGAHAPAANTLRWAVHHVAPTTERACPDTLRVLATPGAGAVTDVRDPTYWAARNLLARLPHVTAAVLIAQGHEDGTLHGSGHGFQENELWNALENAPKHQIEGPWGHEFPNHNRRHPELADRMPRADATWNDTVLEWFGHWLTENGPVPAGLGTVEFEALDGTWRSATAWPPPDARAEVLYLADGGLRPSPGAAAGTFLSAPDMAASRLAHPLPPLDGFNLDDGVDPYIAPFPGPLCPAGGLEPPVPTFLRYESRPLAADAHFAGNPFALLGVESTLPGGLVSLALWDLGPAFRCTETTPVDARPLALGSADLRFHAGNRVGRAFPLLEPTHVRIDLEELMDKVPAGHRVALTASYGDPGAWTTGPFHPVVTLRADGGAHASHVVLPFLEGTLDGAPPTIDYPPRPFLPHSSEPRDPDLRLRP